MKFNPATWEINIDNFPQKKEGDIRIALDCKGWRSLEKIFKATYLGIIRNNPVNFELALSFYPGCENTYILHIETGNVMSDVSHKLPLQGFGANLHVDLALASHYIATQFCAINNLLINRENSHLPVLQYIVSGS